MESIFLGNDEQVELLDDVADFLLREEWYLERSLKHQRCTSCTGRRATARAASSRLSPCNIRCPFCPATEQRGEW